MVRPIDIADTISKTELVRKMNQIKKANPEMEQRQADTIMKQKATSQTEKTPESEKVDSLIITENNKEQEDKKKHRKKEEDVLEEEQNEKESSDEHLDLKA